MELLGPGPLPFEQARARLTPVFQAYRFRLVSLELPERGSKHAFAEFARRDVRIRLVYEGEERVLWLESARQAGNEIVSRWTDIEWRIAGQRRPLERGTDEARLDRLEGALGAFLSLEPSTLPPP